MPIGHGRPASKVGAFFNPTTQPTFVSGTVAWAQADDSWSLTGAARVSGTVAWTQSADAWSLAGAAKASGTIAWTQAADAWALTGSAKVSGTVAITQAADAWALSGAAKVSGSVAITGGPDVWSLASTASVLGPVAYTQAPDVWALSGNVGASSVTGTIAVAQDGDAWLIGGSAISPASIPQGGAGRPHVWKKRIDQTAGEWVEATAHDLYADLQEAPKEVRREAAKLVKPFAKAKEPDAINWAALERDVARTKALLALWQRGVALLEDDDEVAMLEH